MTACPPLEDIAAFLDGTLSPEERARITEHLARCESCYEIFSGVVHFQEEEALAEEEEDVPAAAYPAVKEVALPADPGGVLQFPLAQEKIQEKKARVDPARSTRRVSRWLPLAASVVLAVGLGWASWRLFFAPPEITLAGVLAPIENEVRSSDVLYDNTLRGAGPEGFSPLPSGPSVMVGVHALDLRLSVQANDVMGTASRLQALRGELEDAYASPELIERFSAESQRMKAPEDLDRFRPELPQLEKELRKNFQSSVPFQFGLWAEAGHVAAETDSPEFFEKRAHRRFLSYAQKVLPGQLDEELWTYTRDDLQVIERIWDQGKLSQQDFQTLATRFQNIIHRIDDYDEDLTGGV